MIAVENVGLFMRSALFTDILTLNQLFYCIPVFPSLPCAYFLTRLTLIRGDTLLRRCNKKHIVQLQASTRL